MGVTDNHDFLGWSEAGWRRSWAPAPRSRARNYYLDVTDRLANKGQGMLELARSLGVPPAEVAVIGDGGNDVAMFEQAGLSIAMGNAQPAVKDKAHFVTDSNEAEGFAKAMERFILGGAR